MLFTPQQINEALETIEFHHSFFIAHNLGTRVLTDDQKDLLNKHGIDVDKIKTKYTPHEQAFYFGRLSAALKDQAGKVDYVDFKKYLNREQYQKFSPRTQRVITYLEDRTYSHIKSLSDNIKDDVKNTLEGANQRAGYEDAVRESLKEGAKSGGDQIGRAASEMYKRMGNMQINFRRIAATELQNAFEHARYMEMVESNGDKIFMYKRVYPGACKECIRLYLTGGIGSEPIRFTPQQLLENGDNVGKKRADWKATISPSHPWCRCLLQDEFKTKTKWENGEYTYDYDIVAEARKLPGKIRVTVGDKVFEV